MSDEALRAGKVIKNLSEEHREIRRLYAEQVLRVPLFRLDQQPARMTGMLHGSGAQDRHVPNRLISVVPPCSQREVSSAWREAQRRFQEKSSAARARLDKRAA
jgi:hypothetical protein